MLSSTVNGVTTDYTYGLERISAQTKGQRTEYVTDITGSVIAEVSSKFLSTEVTTKAYTPFGELLTDNSTGFGYNGEYYNAATGMIYLRARFYEPSMNRFSQKDILRGSITDALSLNRYLYCQNDPVNFIDPSGMKLIDTLSNAWNKVVNVAKNIFSPNIPKVTETVKTPASSSVGGRDYQPSPTPTPEPKPTPQPNPTPQYKDGGNNQREQTIYNNTQTQTPGSYTSAQPASVQQFIREQTNCGKRGNVFGVSIKKVGDFLKKESTLKAISAAEGIAGVVLIATGVGGIAGGVLLAGSVSSLLGGGMNEKNGGSYQAGWAGGQVSGLITGTGLGVAGNAISTLGTATSLTASEAVSTVIESEVAAFIGGVVGGGIGDATAQFIDTQQINVEQSVQVGIINGTTSAIAAPISGIPSTISEVVKDTIGGITSAISSVVNEFVFDTSSAIVTSEGVQ